MGSGTQGAPVEPRVHVRVLGSLRPSLTDRGLPYEFDTDVPSEGVVARVLASDLGLPIERVEGVFVNHTVHGLGIVINPGDQIAFVANDTPGPHRFFLGLFAAGKDE